MLIKVAGTIAVILGAVTLIPSANSWLSVLHDIFKSLQQPGAIFLAPQHDFFGKEKNETLSNTPPQ